MTSEELRDKLDYLFTQIGVDTAPWAATLLKTAQSKNIDIAEWNTFVYKVATVAASTDVLVQIADTIAKTFANLTGGDGEGSVQSKSSTATADYAMALGKGLIAGVEALAAFGRYNLADPSALLVVGYGTDEENRKNAFIVHEDGTVSAGADGTNDLDLITKRQLVQTQTNLNQAIANAQAALTQTISKLQGEVDSHEDTMLAFHNMVYTKDNGDDDDSLIEQLQIAIQAIDALIPKDNSGTQADESTQSTKHKLVLRDADGRAYVKDAIVKLETLKNANPDCVINVNVLRKELAKKLDIDKSANGFYKAYGTDTWGNQTKLNVLKEAGESKNSLMSQKAVTDLAEYGTGRNISVSDPKNLVLTEYDTYAEVGDNKSVEFEDSSNIIITTVDIPIKHKRKPVVRVAYNAFARNPHVEHLITYDGLFEIGGEAFNGCSNLRTVVLANSIRRIGFQAFSNCDMLTHIVLPKSLEYIENKAFYNAPLEGIIMIPHTCVSIGGNVGQVFNSKSISAIVFEGTPRWLHPAAFTGCECDIYVPWSEDEVTEATDGTAWGSTGTVHYNTSYPMYVENSLNNLTDRLEDIEAKENYEKITINSVTLTSNGSKVNTVYESGAKLTGLKFAWKVSKRPTRIVLKYGSKTEELTPNEVSIEFSELVVTSDFTWSLTVYEEDYNGHEVSTTVGGSIEFHDAFYYGTFDMSNVKNFSLADVNTASGKILAKTLDDVQFTQDLGSSKYLYFCVPGKYVNSTTPNSTFEFRSALGIEEPTYMSNGNLTSTSGTTSAYRLFRNSQPGIGKHSFEIFDKIERT